MNKTAIQLRKILHEVAPAIGILGTAALVFDGIVRPMIDKNKMRAEHSSALNMIKKSYPEEKHEFVDAVFDMISRATPTIAGNYLIAKTLVDQQMSHMEAISGSHPAGAQISIPTISEAINMEKSTVQSNSSLRPRPEGIAKNILSLAMLGKTVGGDEFFGGRQGI